MEVNEIIKRAEELENKVNMIYFICKYLLVTSHFYGVFTSWKFYSVTGHLEGSLE